MKTPQERVNEIKPNIRWREDMGEFARKECEEVVKQLWEIQEKKILQALTDTQKECREEIKKRIEEHYLEWQDGMDNNVPFVRIDRIANFIDSLTQQ